MNNQHNQSKREENTPYSTPELTLIEVQSEQGFAQSSGTIDGLEDEDYPGLLG